MARVRQGERSRLDLPLPAGFEVVAVNGETVAGWDLEAGEQRITPLVPVRDSFAVVIELAGPPETEVQSPVVVPTGASRSSAPPPVVVRVERERTRRRWR